MKHSSELFQFPPIPEPSEFAKVHINNPLQSL